MGTLPGMVKLAKEVIAGSRSYFSNIEVKRTERWLQENYSKYPTGLDGITVRSGLVTIKLSEELDPQIFASSIDSDDTDVEIEDNNEGGLITIHSRREYPSGRVQRILTGTFQKSKNVPIGSSPVHPEEGEINSRLHYLVGYLEKRYS